MSITDTCADAIAAQKPKLIAAGGDLRQIAAARRLSDTYAVTLFGFDRYSAELPSDLMCTDRLHALPTNTDVLLLPMPTTQNGGALHAPYSSTEFTLPELLPFLKKGGTVLGGRLSVSQQQIIQAAGYRAGDYASREEFCIRNAIPTAEGTIQIAMQELPVTIHGLRCLILGAGRLSKALQTRLSLLGADVTVAARRCSDLAWSGCEEEKPLSRK